MLAAHTHIARDLPGYGGTTATSDDSLAQRALRLAMRIQDQPSPILVGHSMGGVLATMIAEHLPHVRGVIDVDGNLSRGDCTYSGRATAVGRGAFEAHGFADMRAELAASEDPACRGYARAMGETTAATFYRDAEDLVRLSETETLAPRFAALPCAKLFIAGVPRGICARSRQLIADSAVPCVDISPSGHWPFIDRPDAFATAVANFVASLA